MLLFPNYQILSEGRVWSPGDVLINVNLCLDKDTVLTLLSQ